MSDSEEEAPQIPKPDPTTDINNNNNNKPTNKKKSTPKKGKNNLLTFVFTALNRKN